MKKTLFGLFLLLLIGCSKDSTVSPESQLEKDTAAIDKYLADKGITALKDPSGLRYVITTPGQGASPVVTSVCTVKYKGTLMSNGAIFDQSTVATNFSSSSVPGGLPLSSLILGWQIGFQLLSKGSVATLYIPSGLAYGTKGASPTIPTNANLIFDVTLVSFK